MLRSGQSLCDLSVREMARLSLTAAPATVRHWLSRHGLERRTDAAARSVRRSRPPQEVAEPDPRLPAPRAHASRASTRRRVPLRAAAAPRTWSERRRAGQARRSSREAGGRCVLLRLRRAASARCTSITSTRRRRASRLSRRGVDRARSTAARAEAAKCVLLCANCHADVETAALRLELTPVGAGGLSCLAQLTVRGSSIRQSIRLLIEGLWVRVPPPELHVRRRPRGAVARSSAAPAACSSMAGRSRLSLPACSSARRLASAPTSPSRAAARA